MGYILFIILLIGLIGCAAADDFKDLSKKNDFKDLSKKNIDRTDFTKSYNNIKFDKEVKDVNNFIIEKNSEKQSIHIELTNESAEISFQTIGIPLSDLPGFVEFVQIEHYNELDEWDYTQIVKPKIIDNIVYVDVEFTSVTITPYVSLIANGNFESWINTTFPSNWSKSGSVGSIGGSRTATEYMSGSYGYMIAGNGSSVRGEILQASNITPGNYTVGGWVKITGRTSGRVQIDVQGGSPTVDTTGAQYAANTDWRWIESRQYINSTNPIVRVFCDATPNSGSYFYVDDIILSADYSYTATETDNGDCIFQNFTYTPTYVYPTATFVTKFTSTNITDYDDIISVDVKVDGVSKTASIDGNYVLFNSSGLSAAAHAVNITVDYIQQPVVDFSANTTSGIMPKVIAFTDTSTNAPTSWQWNFGDGTSNSTSQNPTHNYTTSGVFNVTLTTTNAGGSGTKTRTSYITIINPNSITSNFTYSGPYSATQFQDTSTGDPASWLWNFGDNTTSTEQNPLHEYSAPGTYTVTLTITKEGIVRNNSYPVAVQIGAPKNYSQHYQRFFSGNMTGWNFASHTGDFWNNILPGEFFWMIIILIPFITIYNRTGTIVIPAMMYLFTGGVLAIVMPPFLGQFYYWFLILGAGGIIYKLYVGE